MKSNVAPTAEDGQSPCDICKAPIWRVTFRDRNGADNFRPIERAPKVRTIVGKLLRERHVGHVGLTFPLPGTDAPIVGCVTRSLTPYRLHACKSFTGSARPAKVRPEPEQLDEGGDR